MELVIAIALLGLIVVAVLAILPGAFRSQRQSEHRIAASSFAEELLNYCNSQSVVSFPLGDWTPATAAANFPFLRDRTLDDQVVLRPELKLENGSVDLSQYLRQITVSVSWNENNQTMRVVRYRRVTNLRR